MKVKIDKNLCVGCGTCEAMCSGCFKLGDSVAEVISDECLDCDVKEVAKSCPVGAIEVSGEQPEGFSKKVEKRTAK